MVHRPRPRLPLARPTPTAIACGLLLCSLGAQSQQAPAPKKDDTPATETIVVTGIRGSLETSINLKRASSGLVDGIVAEDIGKFPDTNLAESLSRISGVSIERTNGEGTKVTVRGMGPDFNLVLLNGRQMPGSNFDGSAPSSRSFDFSNLASDGIAAMEVYKTSRASSPTGGMGATINVRTQRPFDIKGTLAQFGVKAVHDQTAGNLPSEIQGDKVTPELSGIYSTQSSDGTFGIALMGTYQVRDSGYNAASVTSGWKSFRGTVDNDWGAGTAQWGGLPPAAWGAIKNRPTPDSIYSVPQNLNYSFTSVHRERVNGQAVVQLKPTKDLVATLDFVMSEQKFRQRRNDISAWFNYGGQFGEYQTGSPSSPIIYGETMTDSDVGMGTSRINTKVANQQIGLNLKWKASDALSFDFDAHHSTAESRANDPLGTSVVLGTASLNRGDTFVDFSNKFPVLNIKGGTLNPALQQLQGSVFSNSYQKNEIEQFQGRGKWKINPDSSLDFGLALTTVKNRSAFAVVQRDSWGNNAAGGPAAMPDNIWRADSISKYFSGIPGSSDPRLYNQFFAFKFEDVRDAAIKALGSDELLKASFNFKDDYRTKEKSESLYTQYNLGWDLAGIPMDVAAGLRYERTSVVSPSIEAVPTGVRWSGDNELPIIFTGTTAGSRSGKYSYVLPSIDFSADVTTDSKVRLSYGHTIGRPGWASLQGGRTIDRQASIGGGTGAVGNPELKPLQSKNWDLAFEHYYAKGSYVALSLFKKSLKDYNESIVVAQTIPGVRTPVGGAYFQQAVQQGGCAPTNSGCIRQWIFTNLANSPGVDATNRTITAQPGDPLMSFNISTFQNNKQKSTINGIELNAQHMFGRSGFGLGANFTKVRSNRSYDNNKVGAQTDVLTGMGDSGNLMGFYENAVFNARLAYNWRSKFLLANYGGAEGAQPLYAEPFGVFDLSMGYNVGKNLRVQFDAINLTNEYARTHLRNENQIGSVTQLGRRFMLGARYKF